MAKQVRVGTKYPGVFLVASISPATNKADHIIYIRYKKCGSSIEEKVGRTSVDAMTPAKAALIRGDRLQGKSQPNRVRREVEKAAKEAIAQRWTVEKIWNAYDEAHADRACVRGDAAFIKHILPEVGSKEPAELVNLDLERLKRIVAKKKNKRTGKPLSAQTVKHVLALLKRMLRWAAEMEHIEIPHHLKFKMPRLDNEKTEFMSDEQLAAYLKALDEEVDQDKAAFFRIMLLTGIRRTALLNVRWDDLDLKKGFIVLRGEVAKNDKTQSIPLSDGAVNVFKSIPPKRFNQDEKKGEIIPYVWPAKNQNGPREDMRRVGRRLRDKAGLPKDWRPCHMLRHTFASHLACSGANIYELQKLLTHGSPAMTQRYAHLSNEALKRTVSLADNILNPEKTSIASSQARGQGVSA